MGVGEVWIMSVKVKGWGGMPNEGESGGLEEVWIMG